MLKLAGRFLILYQICFLLFRRTYPSGSVNEKARDIFESYIKDPANLAFRSIPDPAAVKDQWFAFLKKEYKNDLAKLNAAWGKTYSAWEKIAPPTGEYEWFSVLENRKLLIKEFLTRNYIMVIDTIITNGYAGRNTLIYCFLAVLAALTSFSLSITPRRTAGRGS